MHGETVKDHEMLHAALGYRKLNVEKIPRGKRQMATKDGENCITHQPNGKMIYKRR